MVESDGKSKKNGQKGETENSKSKFEISISKPGTSLTLIALLGLSQVAKKLMAQSEILCPAKPLKLISKQRDTETCRISALIKAFVVMLTVCILQKQTSKHEVMAQSLGSCTHHSEFDSNQAIKDTCSAIILEEDCSPNSNEVSTCSCSDHPANLIASHTNHNLLDCYLKCWNDKNCMIYLHDKSAGNCHTYSKDCTCSASASQKKYQILRDGWEQKIFATKGKDADLTGVTPTVLRYRSTVNGLSQTSHSYHKTHIHDNYRGETRGNFDVTDVGGYKFTVEFKMGVRLFIDDKLILEQWIDKGSLWKGTTLAATKVLTPGTHSIYVEYFEAYGHGEKLKVNWQFLGEKKGSWVQENDCRCDTDPSKLIRQSTFSPAEMTLDDCKNKCLYEPTCVHIIHNGYCHMYK